MKMEENINIDIKNAMIEKNEVKLEALRTIKTSIQTEKAKEGTELSDEQVIKLIQTLVSKRTESVTQYTQGGRPDLADHENDLIAIFKLYLPEQLSESEIESKVKEIIATLGATSIKDMGKVMTAANAEFTGKANPKSVGMIVKNLLSK